MFAGTRVLVLSSYSDDEYIRQATEGRSGVFAQANRSCGFNQGHPRGEKRKRLFQSGNLETNLENYRDAFLKGAPVGTRVDRLTSREAEVLQLVAEGKANKQISAELCVSVKTVEKHRQQMMNKLNIHDVAASRVRDIQRGSSKANVSPRL